MTQKNIDFSSNLRSLYSSRVSNAQGFVESIVQLLKAKVVDHNNRNLSGKVNLSQLKEVYKRGVHDAIRLDKPIGFWSIARVNMFLRYSKGAKVEYSYKKLDRDILNDPSFFIDDGVRDDIIFTYEQVSEARFEVESFNLINHDENYDFVDLEEFAKDSFLNQPKPKAEG